MEIICALAIVSLGITASLTLFNYGTGWLEKQGLRRQALARLQGRLETLHACSAEALHHDAGRCDSLTGTQPVKLHRMLWGKPREVEAVMQTDISGSPEHDGPLRYRQVCVRITYEDGMIHDEMSVATRLYLY